MSPGNKKKFAPLARALLSLLVVAVATIMAGAPISLEVQRKAGNAEQIPNQIARVKPDIILMGNSMLGEGVEPGQLQRQLKLKVHALTYGGSASAIWFLWLKNAVIPSKWHPDTIILFFSRPISYGSWIPG